MLENADRSQPDEDDVNLRESLTALSQLRVGTGSQGLQEMLVKVAVFAAQAIPGADGVGITLLERGRSDTIVASTDFVETVMRFSTDSDRGRASPPPPIGGPCTPARWSWIPTGRSSALGRPPSVCIVCCRCRSSPTRTRTWSAR